MVPISVKIAYTLFVALLVPNYWRQYGPANFLWFSDIALLMMVPALWLESQLLVSMTALSILLLELVWNIDFFFRLIKGVSLIGLSAYMFDPKISWFIRSLSFFHIVLPLLIVWMLHRLGYDQRALLWQTLMAIVVLPLSYLVSNPRENVNWVYGFGEEQQTALPAPLFVTCLMLAFPILVYLPMHLLLSRIFGSRG
ncbi:MAG: membrane-associated protein [Verrucomicrobia bacterium]|nr:MAG: membrane-associated protein [Verrucomicrobiota bacterium]